MRYLKGECKKNRSLFFQNGFRLPQIILPHILVSNPCLYPSHCFTDNMNGKFLRHRIMKYSVSKNTAEKSNSYVHIQRQIHTLNTEINMVPKTALHAVNQFSIYKFDFDVLLRNLIYTPIHFKLDKYSHSKTNEVSFHNSHCIFRIAQQKINFSTFLKLGRKTIAHAKINFSQLTPIRFWSHYSFC